MTSKTKKVSTPALHREQLTDEDMKKFEVPPSKSPLKVAGNIFKANEMEAVIEPSRLTQAKNKLVLSAKRWNEIVGLAANNRFNYVPNYMTVSQANGFARALLEGCDHIDDQALLDDVQRVIDVCRQNNGLRVSYRDQATC